MTQRIKQLTAILADGYRLDCETGHRGMPPRSAARDLEHEGVVALEMLHLVTAR